jgi:hypothetical protein
MAEQCVALLTVHWRAGAAGFANPREMGRLEKFTKQSRSGVGRSRCNGASLNTSIYAAAQKVNVAPLCALPKLAGRAIIQCKQGGSMGFRTFAAVAAAFLAQQSAVQAQPAVAQPAPAARWSVDGASGRCAITRPVQSPFPATLVVRAWPTVGSFELMLISKDLPKGLRTDGQQLQIDFAPNGARHASPAVLFELDPAVGKALAADMLPPQFLEDFGESQSLTLSVRGTTVGSFAYSGAAKVVAAFGQCSAAKLIEWGADPAAFGPGGTHARPIGDSSKWVGPGDLRESSNKSGSASAMVVARLAVAADGKVDDCTVLETNRQSFGAAACRSLLKRARFEPARNAEGQGVRTVVLHTMRWGWENRLSPDSDAEAPIEAY